ASGGPEKPGRRGGFVARPHGSRSAARLPRGGSKAPARGGAFSEVSGARAAQESRDRRSEAEIVGAKLGLLLERVLLGSGRLLLPHEKENRRVRHDQVLLALELDLDRRVAQEEREVANASFHREI